MLAQGLSFVEVGTVTPMPQEGNPRPRLFRLREDRAVINRMGFNNEGHDALRRRLEARRERGGIVGVNIGANKDSADRIADYVRGYKAFADIASYLTVNISSPNTPGLRDLQARNELEALLGRLNDARAGREFPPLLVKIAPDLEDAALDDMADVFLRHEGRRRHRLQHDLVAAWPHIIVRRRGRRPVRPAALPAFDPDTGALVPATRTAHPA